MSARLTVNVAVDVAEFSFSSIALKNVTHYINLYINILCFYGSLLDNFHMKNCVMFHILVPNIYCG